MEKSSIMDHIIIKKYSSVHLSNKYLMKSHFVTGSVFSALDSVTFNHYISVC